jgi:hypothetical protein
MLHCRKADHGVNAFGVALMKDADQTNLPLCIIGNGSNKATL